MAQAIDVFGKYQGNINWPEVAANGVKYAFIKVTNGTGKAFPAADEYVQEARNAGIIPGGYHYALGGYPGEEARVFLAELQRLDLLEHALIPADDFEDPSMPRTPDARRWWISNFAQWLNITGKAPRQLIYSNANELNSIHAGTITAPAVELLVWDGEWGPNDGALHPIVHYTGTVAVQQYTSAGDVPGIAGHTDRDWINQPIFTDTTPAPPLLMRLPATTVLHRGMTGTAVQLLQRTLNRGYPDYSHLMVDGIYGPATTAVVEDFQRRSHLTVDGIAGPITLAALHLVA